MSATTETASEAILLDADVLVAASVSDHEHYARASAWLDTGRRRTAREQSRLAPFDRGLALLRHDSVELIN